MTVAGCPTSDTRNVIRKLIKHQVSILVLLLQMLLKKKKKKKKKKKNQLWMLQRLIILGKMQKP